MRVLLTGSSGYIGSAVLNRLVSSHDLVTVGRRPSTLGVEHFTVADISGCSDWSTALAGVDVIVHCAGRAHVKDDDDARALHQSVNTDGTARLARQAAERGVRRIVFISSIGVNGNESRRPFHADDEPNPLDAYAISKYEAEQALWATQEEFSLEVVIVRPPLVYGPNAPGNFGRLTRAIQRGIPLPLGAVSNIRSFVALDNLVDLIALCVEKHEAANQTFLAADGEDVSTRDFLRRLGYALGRPARLLPIPVPLLESAAGFLGRQDLIRKLCCDLQVDIGKVRDILGWHPPVSVDEALRRVARGTRQGMA